MNLPLSSEDSPVQEKACPAKKYSEASHSPEESSTMRNRIQSMYQPPSDPIEELPQVPQRKVSRLNIKA